LTLRFTHPSITHRIALTSGSLTATFQTHLEDQIPFYLELHNEMAIDMCVENSEVILKALAASTPSVDRVPTHGL